MLISKRFRLGGLVALAALALASAACGGGDSTGPGTNPDPGVTNGTLYVSNDSDREIWYVFTRACGSTAWSDDHLGSDIIPLQTSETFTVAAGCYDVRLLSQPEGGPGGPKHEVVRSNETVPAGGQVIVEVSTWPAEATADVASMSLRSKR
jgi:hypothetical protein